MQFLKQAVFASALCLLYPGCRPEERLVASLPQVELTVGEEIPDDPPVALHLRAADQMAIGEIERRGGFSIGFPKHSYEIDLEEEIALAGLPADDDWILNANYIDKTFLRHVIAYELFREMSPDNRAARTRFVEVSLNGKYQGLYVLMEKVDRSVLGANKREVMTVIFKEPPVFRERLPARSRRRNVYQQTFPKFRDRNLGGIIESIWYALKNYSGTDFDAYVGREFDLDNIIDWHLLLLTTNNSDGILKNFYLYRTDNGSPLRIAPWDYDHSFGRDGDNELNLIRPLDTDRSLLLRKLNQRPWYRERLAARWETLNTNGLLSVRGLQRRIRRHRDVVAPFVERNFERWPLQSEWYYDANDFAAEIEIMLTFVEQRHAQLTELFAGYSRPSEQE